jgi:TldD protein
MVNEEIFGLMGEGLEMLNKSKYTFEDPTGQKTNYNPFFGSFNISSSEKYGLEFINGGLIKGVVPFKPSIKGTVGMMMGDYNKGAGRDSTSFSLPLDIDKVASLQRIWHAVNNTFWGCTENYEERKLSSLGSKEQREKYVFFSKESPNVDLGNDQKIHLDMGDLEQLLKKVSKDLLSDNILSNFVDFELSKNNKYFMNSEGSKIFSSYMRYSIALHVNAVDSKNRVIPHSKVFYGLEGDELPTYDQLMEAGEILKEEVLDIVKSPIQKNGIFPTILDGKNNGVLWHEVIGHALEAHGMQESMWGGKTSLFLGKLEKMIAPEFISLYDDPTIPNLDGSYKFDEEGVRSQRVELIKDGVLKNYLHSRSSAAFFNTSSNGHARASPGNASTPRMSNLIVESSNQVNFEQLKEYLIHECEKQSKDYGLLLTGTAGGLTLPEESFFQTFPSQVFQIDRHGKTKRVRGIYIVGTPYQTMNNMIQTSDRQSVFQGSCGAESGWIPSTISAPDALINSLELNRIPSDSYEELDESIVPKPKI